MVLNRSFPLISMNVLQWVIMPCSLAYEWVLFESGWDLSLSIFMPESHINWVFLPICQGSGLKLITNRQGSPWPLNAFLLTLLLVAWQLNSSILYLCTCCQDHTFPKASGLHKANGRISLPLWWSGSAAKEAAMLAGMMRRGAQFAVSGTYTWMLFVPPHCMESSYLWSCQSKQPEVMPAFRPRFCATMEMGLLGAAPLPMRVWVTFPSQEPCSSWQIFFLPKHD